MGVLDRVDSPADLRSLSEAEMETLASEIRTFLIEKVAATGGHLGPNLGVVELTLGSTASSTRRTIRSSSTPATSATSTRS